METRRIIVIAGIIGGILILVIILGISIGGDERIPSGGRADMLVKGECPKEYGTRPLLVVCMDGFQTDYLKRGLTPTLTELAEQGVQAEYMIPSYPTVTFPNHYTIVTGLYPEAHGIIGNNFFDPVFQKKFKLGGSLKNEGRWWGGEPIWNTLNRHGKKSATFFWPGSEADIGGYRPTYWFPYDNNLDYGDRIKQVLEWLMLPIEDRPEWISLYFNEPDTTGHKTGPDSPETNEKLKEMDNYIRQLLQGLIERNIINCINIVILSDHGMAKAGKAGVIDVIDYVPDFKEYGSMYGGASGKVALKNQSEEVELNIMHQFACKRDEMRVYQPESLPKRLHFASNNRIEDVILDVDAGYTMTLKSSWAIEGVHGYDNIFPEMNTIFLAYGPDFHSKRKVKPFQNIEVYNLMCHLTGVSPANNNGTWGSLHHLLLSPPAYPELQKSERPSVLKYPKDGKVNLAGGAGCEGDKTVFEPWMPSLDMKKAQEEEVESYHAPWGIPNINNTAVNISLLYHMDHITGFSTTLKMPLWTSFTVNPEHMNNDLKDSPGSSKWSSDFRMQPDITPTCSDYESLKQFNISMEPLFPSAFSSNRSQDRETSYLISNAIPINKDIQKRWQGLLEVLASSWVASEGPLNFVLGPVFDDNFDSHPDDLTDFSNGTKIPSDLFCVLTRCQTAVTSLNRCPERLLDNLAFIFHQNQPISNCLTLEEFSLKFSARVKDVELVTGLTLFPDIPFEHKIRKVLSLAPQLWALP